MNRLLVIGAVLVALTGCSAMNLNLPGSGPSVAIQEGAAPSATAEGITIRADQVTRSGDTIGVGITLATVKDLDVSASSFDVTTSSGISVEANFEDRSLPAGSTAAIALSMPLPESTVTSVIIKPAWNGPEITVPIPTEDESWAWLPAPLRQVGLPANPVRTGESEVSLDAISSSGMITEISYRAQGLNGNPPNMCFFWILDDFDDKCTLTESDGTVHPVIRSDTSATPDDARLTGTLRFLGELNTASTDLTLLVSDGAHDTVPVSLSLPTHADSPTVAAAGDSSRPKETITPVTLDGPAGTPQVTVDAIEVLSGSTQVHITATGGDDDFPLEGGKYDSVAGLTDSSGAFYALMKPLSNGLVVKAGGTMDAILVFQGSIPANITTLTLQLGGGWVASDRVLSGTLTIPAGTSTEPPTEPTLSEVEESAEPEAPAITATPVPVTVEPSAPTSAQAEQPDPEVTIVAATIEQLPTSGRTVMGPVRSSISGNSSGSQVASGDEVDPAADAEAQQTLEDLGAQRTPDGWVLTLPETVLFDYNQADVLPAAESKLTEVADLLNYFDTAQIAVQGHTDSDGSDEANQDLSQRRALAVADSLASKGVTASRMSVEGYGEAEPIASNANDEGKAKNRRVEIVLAEKD